MHLKPEIRILGIDDSPLLSDSILVVGALMRGGGWLDGVLRSYIDRDGTNANERLAAMITGSKHYGQIRIVMLNGVTFGGFNVVDIQELHRATALPVIAVMRRAPDMAGIRAALDNLPDPERRYQAILNAGPITEVQTPWRGHPVYIQCKGIEPVDAAEIVAATAVHSRLPEPLRMAHLISTGIVLGESSKRA
ncbi:DUF99 family protein [Methanocella sp. MCL-LM]|uniref:endonuclease dU n=1 Tax=Methanocella sp. MCL-LM TaxID=3412035 RepID=UPI003C76D2D4